MKPTVVLFGVVNLLFMGYSHWLKLADWHGGLPPISLVVFVFSVVSFILEGVQLS